MSDQEKPDVTMRIKVGDSELEVTGPQNFVEEKIEKFIQSIKMIPSIPAAPPGKATSAGVGSKVEPNSKVTSISQFMKKFNPKTDSDRVLGAGFFLEKYRNFDKFTAAEVRDGLRDAKIKPPKNPNAVIDRNIKKGYMMSAGDKDGKIGFVLTSDGEEYIEESMD